MQDMVKLVGEVCGERWDWVGEGQENDEIEEDEKEMRWGNERIQGGAK
jgi:hypothetical protein